MDKLSSVSVGGGGKDSGKGEEVVVAVNAADIDVATLRCVVSSGSPTWSAYLAGGRFCVVVETSQGFADE